MIKQMKMIWQILILASLLVLAGLLIIHYVDTTLTVSTFLLTSLVCTTTTIGVYLLLQTGLKKDEKEQLIYTLAAIGGKFLVYLVFIFVYWAVTKNLDKAFIISFFTLYLFLTLYLVYVLVKILKTN